MPGEALQVIRYTIEASISQYDKKKPWIWMNKLRTHYTGTTWCTLMTHRFKFWHASQNRNETIQDWEVQIRQAGSLCEYGDITDIMYRDKFVFGLCNNTIRTELLKTHLRPDNTPKALADVVADAQSMECAQRPTNSLLIETKELATLSNGQGQGDPNHCGKSIVIWNWGASQAHVISVGIWKNHTNRHTARLLDAPVRNAVGRIILHVYVESSHLWITNPTNLEITIIHRNGQGQTIRKWIQFRRVTNQKRTQHACPLEQSMINQTSKLMSNYYITVPHTQWSNAKRIINQVINIMLIYHTRQMDLLILISNSKLTLLQRVIQFHMTLSKNISQTTNFRSHVICYTLMEIAYP